MVYELNGFFASWCPHCIQFKPIWNKLNEYYKNNKNLKINTYYDGLNNDIISKNNISGYPTIQLKAYNRIYDINRGNAQDMIHTINKIINGEKDTNIKSIPTMEKFADLSPNGQFKVFNEFLNDKGINLNGGCDKNCNKGYVPAYSGGSDDFNSQNTSYLESPEQFYKEKYMKYKMKYLNLKKSLNKQ